jgi:2-hydroxy-3-keto-5-methylthiopentenyl-1-phosphate phosphatase
MSARLGCHVLVDFDGTIATVDTTDRLLERFADPRWLAVEEDWKTGRIGSRECLVRQVDLVRATPAEMEEFVSGIEIDPGFPAFVALCRQNGLKITVVSDGLDFTVSRVLAAAGLPLEYRANHLEFLGGDRWRLGFPHARSDCRALSGNCKCQFAEDSLGQVRIVVGDGRSDFCVAGRADLVLAKSALERHCRMSGLPHYAFTAFPDATRLLAQWLDERSSKAPAFMRTGKSR